MITFAASVALAASTLVTFTACSDGNVAGTDEQTNSIADKVSSSSEGPVPSTQSSSSSIAPSPSDIILPIPDSTVYIHTDVRTTQENLAETRDLILGNDSLLPKIGSRDTMAIYRNIIQTDSIGPLYYGMNDQNDKFVFCNRAFYDYGKEHSFDTYSTYRTADTVIKRVETTDASILELFKTECEAEAGIYNLEQRTSCKYQKCEFDNATCTILGVDSVYFDPTWGKFSLMVLDMCSGPTLDSIQRRNLPEVLSGYTLNNDEKDSLNSNHTSHTLFGTNRLTYSYQVTDQFAACSDENDEYILTYDVYLQDRVSPGYVHKTIQDGYATLLDEFKQDCKKEGGLYFMDIFPTCEIPLTPIETRDSTEYYQYTDPNWEKYSQKVIDSCKE